MGKALPEMKVGGPRPMRHPPVPPPVVKTLFKRAKKLSSTAPDLNIEMKYAKRTLMLNCYLKSTIQNKKSKKHNGVSVLISEVILLYTTDLGETLK